MHCSAIPAARRPDYQTVDRLDDTMEPMTESVSPTNSATSATSATAATSATSATAATADGPSRRKFLVGGLAFLAACSSGSTTGDDNAIILGGDQTPTSTSAVTTGSAPETAAAPIGPTPTPDPERADVMAVDFNYLDGTPGQLSDFAGTPLVINFFAGWCPPCRAELPDFEAIFQKYKGQVEFLGFSVLDDVETTQQLLDETGVTFTVALDPTQDIHFDLGGIAMPTTLFVDRYGKLAGGRFGAIPKDDLEAMILEEIL